MQNPGSTTAHAHPIVIAHRGASGHRPEHTLAAYALAIEQGADYIEPDVVPTRDHELVVRHENEISGTTDVAAHPEFIARRTTKRIDGVEITGWFTEDFSLAELKTLRARERLPELRPGNCAFDGQETIATLAEVFALARAASRRLGRPVGIYPETKHPSYFAQLGLPLEAALVAALGVQRDSPPEIPVFIQSFEVASLRQLRALTSVPLVQLMDAGGAPWDFQQRGDPRGYAQLATPEGLREIADYAQAIGVNKQAIVPRAPSGALATPTSLVEDAHALGLAVHAWTFRSENAFLPKALMRGDPAEPGHLRAHGDAAAEYALFFSLGIDAAFSDFPDAAIAARALL